MEQAHNLTDRTFIILRKRNFLELTFQEFRGQYATTFNVMNPPERAKLMKLPIIKVSYSAKHKKQTMKIFLEKDYLCDSTKNCTNDACHKLHCLKTSDRCYLFDRDHTCNNPKCTKLHIPSKSLHQRITQIFKKSGRSSMPFSKFIVLHRTTYPLLREHHPTNDILSTEEFIEIVRIENTEKTKEIRLLRRNHLGGIERPPSLSENIDAPYPALKIISFDNKWIDSNNLLNDIINLFSCYTIKDIFIPGHSRMAFVTFNSHKNAQNAVKKLNNTWFCGRKVNVALTLQNINDNDEEKVPLSSSRIVIKAINNVISGQRIKEWLDSYTSGRIIDNILTCYNECRSGSDIAYIHFKSMKIIHEILNKEKKNNYLVTFRGKQIKFMLVDDGYTDSCSYYMIKKTHLNPNNPNIKSIQNDDHKQSRSKPKIKSKLKINSKIKAPPISHAFSMPDINKTNKKQNDSMQLLVMRLKSLMENTLQTQKDLQYKIQILGKINGDNTNIDQDTDIAFGDESFTISALKESLFHLENDVKQILVYKQALTAFETSQSRAIHKNQRELKPICEKEIRLAKSLQSVHCEIESLEKQLLSKKNEQNVIKSDLEITRIKVKTLRKNISDMKHKIEPIKHCLNENKNVILVTDQEISEIECNLKIEEKNITHWLKWKEWNLSHATKWIGSLANGKFKQDLSKFNALSKISRGSILNAITDPTLQIIGFDDEKDRKIILNNIALLKSRTAMMRKSQNSFDKRAKLSNSNSNGKRRKSLSSPNVLKKNSEKTKYNRHSLNDIQDLIRSASMQSENSDNLCVICMDREIAPFAIVPCGHQSLCSICKNLIKPNKHKCPMCNGKVTMIIKLFRA